MSLNCPQKHKFNFYWHALFGSFILAFIFNEWPDVDTTKMTMTRRHYTEGSVYLNLTKHLNFSHISSDIQTFHHVNIFLHTEFSLPLWFHWSWWLETATSSALCRILYHVITITVSLSVRIELARAYDNWQIIKFDRAHIIFAMVDAKEMKWCTHKRAQ